MDKAEEQLVEQVEEKKDKTIFSYIKPVKKYGTGDLSNVVGTYIGAPTVGRRGNKKDDRINFRERDPKVVQSMLQNQIANVQNFTNADGRIGAGMSLTQGTASSFADQIMQLGNLGYTVQANSDGTKFSIPKDQRREIYNNYKNTASRGNADNLQAVIAVQILNLISRYGKLEQNDQTIVAYNRAQNSKQFKDYNKIKAQIKQLKLNRVKGLTQAAVFERLQQQYDLNDTALVELAKRGLRTEQDFRAAIGHAGRMYGAQSARKYFE